MGEEEEGEASFNRSIPFTKSIAFCKYFQLVSVSNGDLMVLTWFIVTATTSG